MTRSEWLGSLWSGELAVGWRVPGVPFHRRLQLAFLKFVAITGYYYGKGSPERSPSSLEGHEPQPTCGSEGSQPSNPQRRAGEGLKLAVVIPFYARTPREVAQLLTALWKLHQQTRPADTVYLVDDGSPFPLPPNLGNPQVQILRMEKNRGPAAARNMGIRRARQEGVEVVCFMDADCEPEATWLAEMEAFQLKQPGLVCGLTLAASPATAIGLYHDVCGTLNGRIMKDGSILYGCTCNLSVNLAVMPFEFDERFRGAAFEDVDLCVRARENGIAAGYNPHAVVTHHYDAGVAGLFRQFRRYGSAEPIMLAKHAQYLALLSQSKEISSLQPPVSAAAAATEPAYPSSRQPQGGSPNSTEENVPP